MIDFDAAVALAAGLGQGVVAIDGLPVSGKSTLAGRLETELGARVLYLDDFLLPEAAWRGQVLPGFPFPYCRYGQFMAAVRDVTAGRPARYQPYDWVSGRLGNWVELATGGLVVVEGVSALHGDLAPLYDLRLWVESDASTTLEASLARGVGDWSVEWRELFMPSVALYLATEPHRRADHCVAGRGVRP